MQNFYDFLDNVPGAPAERSGDRVPPRVGRLITAALKHNRTDSGTVTLPKLVPSDAIRCCKEKVSVQICKIRWERTDIALADILNQNSSDFCSIALP